MTSMGGGDAHDELEATLQARQELGPAYDHALADSFVDRIDERLDERGAKSAWAKYAEGAGDRQLVLGFVSLSAGIPITALAAGTSDNVWGVVVAWLGIVGVNAAHAWSSRRSG